MFDSDKAKEQTQLPKFDADLSFQHPTNRKAARARGLRFDEKKQQYVDSGGNPVRDRFGQPY